MGGRGGGAPAARTPAPAPAPARVERRFSDDVSLPLDVRIAVALEEMRVARREERWEFSDLVDLHDKLSDIPWQVVNREILRMDKENRSLSLIPQSNQKILTQRQRDTAVTLGNERKHLIKLLPRGRDRYGFN